MTVSLLVGFYTLHLAIGLVYAATVDPHSLVVLANSLLPKDYHLGAPVYRHWYDCAVLRLKQAFTCALRTHAPYPKDEDWHLVQYHELCHRLPSLPSSSSSSLTSSLPSSLPSSLLSSVHSSAPSSSSSTPAAPFSVLIALDDSPSS